MGEQIALARAVLDDAATLNGKAAIVLDSRSGQRPAGNDNGSSLGSSSGSGSGSDLVTDTRVAAACRSSAARQQRLYFFPLPQGQGSFRPI